MDFDLEESDGSSLDGALCDGSDNNKDFLIIEVKTAGDCSRRVRV